MNVLEFDSIEKTFSGRRILSSIYMRCDTGTTVALLGRNASGKSTLMKIVFGFMESEFQSVRINKMLLNSPRNKMQHIGYLPQGQLLPKSLTVRDALHDFNLKSDDLIEFQPGYKDFLRHSARELSGGLQRLFEAFLIVKSKKDFILLDEPFSGIMPVYVEALKELINYEKSRKGIIVSDHLYRHTLDLADHIYLLKEGKTYLINNRDELVFRGYLST